jgi:hypothetical protein
METEAPIYEQIIQMENIELHKMSKIVESKGGLVVDLSTDCIYCTFPDDILPFTLSEDKNIIGYDHEKNVPMYKLEEGYNRLKCEKMSKLVRNDVHDYKPKDWTIYDDVKDNDFTPLVNMIFDKNESFNIDGRAGTGKSYLIKGIQDRIKKEGKTYITLAPTNKACINIDGITLHKFVGSLRSKKSINKLNVDFIIIDEISMVKEIFYKFLITLKKTKENINFIIVGDFGQLPPINDRVNMTCKEYKNCSALLELCDANRINLSTCRRSDSELFGNCKNVEFVEKTNFNSKFTFKHISYTHKTRIIVNEIMMKKRKQKYHKTDYLIIDKSEFDEHSQEVILCPKVPIIAKVTKKSLDIVNNEEFIIEKIVDDEIHIFNENKKMIILEKDFQNLFYPAYCITIHSSQGTTFNEEYTIHDWNILSNELKYVALSRGHNKDQINTI